MKSGRDVSAGNRTGESLAGGASPTMGAGSGTKPGSLLRRRRRRLCWNSRLGTGKGWPPSASEPWRPTRRARLSRKNGFGTCSRPPKSNSRGSASWRLLRLHLQNHWMTGAAAGRQSERIAVPEETIGKMRATRPWRSAEWAVGVLRGFSGILSRHHFGGISPAGPSNARTFCSE